MESEHTQAMPHTCRYLHVCGGDIRIPYNCAFILLSPFQRILLRYDRSRSTGMLSYLDLGIV